jgi:hypothetical protein
MNNIKYNTELIKIPENSVVDGDDLIKDKKLNCQNNCSIM